MPTSPHLAITNSPKVIVKSVRSAGSMWASTPTRNRENLRESVGADDSVRPQKIRFLRKLSANSQLPLGGQGRPLPTNLTEALQNRVDSVSSACSRSVSMSLSPKTSMPFFLKSAAVTPSPGVSLPEKVPS